MLLAPLFDTVDMCDGNESFLAESSAFLGTKVEEKIGEKIVSGLEKMELKHQYDLIWVQWVIIYLKDQDLVDFLAKCKKALTPCGAIVIKENITRSGFILDKGDASITRSEDHLKCIFAAAGLEVVKEKLQSGFPKQIFLVRMYALR